MRIIAIFNLKPGVKPEQYETWARETDPPTVAKMRSIDSFTSYRTTGILNSDDAPPYSYVEVIEVNDLDLLKQEIQSELVQRVSKEFRELADNPRLMLTETFY